MHTQLLSSSSRLLDSIFILLTFLILFLIPPCYCQDADRFNECQQHSYSCGENITEIGYPFWGNGRPQFCGHPQFELKCQNEDGYPVMDIGNRAFRVTEINKINDVTGAMRIARLNLQEEYCPQEFSNFTFDSGLFSYAIGTENLTIFYNCTSIDSIRYPYNFTCAVDGTETRAFYAIDSYVRARPPDGKTTYCRESIKVPIDYTTQNLLASGSLALLQQALLQEIRVEYHTEVDDCLKCVASGGLCGSDLKTNESVCNCKDHSEDPKLCRYPGAKKNMLALKIGASATAVGILLICIAIYLSRQKSFLHKSVVLWKKKSKDDQHLEEFIRNYGSLAPKRFSYSDIKKMTNSLRDKLGQGGYGSVYKGKLLDGRLVAVKILNASKGNGEEFINEVASISRTSHVNIVSFLGFCFEGKKRALIYEFMPNGSLEKFIYGESPFTTGGRLEWEKLYHITLGIARGLEYLHTGCVTRILHFDIKPHNILLDDDFCPKIADFGLAKLCTRKESIVSMAEARGTIGYIAPEVFSRNFGGVSYKSDVYSYGMMVLEMVGGRKNINVQVDHTSEIYFPHWIYKRLEIDEGLGLQGDMTKEEAEITKKMILVGLWCIQTDPSQRPSMGKVIEMLEGSVEALEIPPKPYLASPSRSPPVNFSSKSSSLITT